MNKSKKRMKNKKGRNGNRSVKMRGGNRFERINEALGKAAEATSKAARSAYTATSDAARTAATATGDAARTAATATGDAYTATSAAVGKAFTATSYEKQFDKKVLDHISGKKDIIKSVESLKETVFNLHSKIEKADKQLDIFKNAYSKGKTIEPKLNAYLNNFSEARNKHFETYENFINSKKIENLLDTHMKEALNKQYTAQEEANELEQSGKVAQKAVSDAQKAVSDSQNAVSDAKKAVSDVKKNLEDANKKNPLDPNTTETLALRDAEKTLIDAQNVLTVAETPLINAQTESAKTAANEFLNNVSSKEATALYNIIKNFLEEYKKSKNTLNSILFDNYKRHMYELIDEKKKMYNQIFKYKKNYTKLENETFFDRIINQATFTQYDKLVKLYDDIVNELKKIYFSDPSKRLLELANNINKYDLSSFEDLVPAPAAPISPAPPGYKKDAKAKAEESKKLTQDLRLQLKDAEKKAKEDEKKVKMIDERKITDININFYKSNFENKNPFPYYEQVVLNRSGQGVIGDLYGVEELFPTFKGELDFIIDKDKRDIFNPPFKRKNIKIEHTKNDKSAPTFNIFE